MASRNYRDKLNQKVLGGPTAFTNANSSSLNQWFGDTLCTSRNTFVAAPLIAATDRVRLDAHWYGTPSLAVWPGLVVSSTQAGSGFYISTVQSVGFGAAGTASVAVWWEIVKR
jgi:hypothetical protein